MCKLSSHYSIVFFLSKLLEHLLLPEIESNCDFTPFQFGFRKSFGCSHAHYILSRLMKDAVKSKMFLYCLTVDCSGAFDNIVHSQALKFRLPGMAKYQTQ